MTFFFFVCFCSFAFLFHDPATAVGEVERYSRRGETKPLASLERICLDYDTMCLKQSPHPVAANKAGDHQPLHCTMYGRPLVATVRDHRMYREFWKESPVHELKETLCIMRCL